MNGPIQEDIASYKFDDVRGVRQGFAVLVDRLAQCELASKAVLLLDDERAMFLGQIGRILA